MGTDHSPLVPRAGMTRREKLLLWQKQKEQQADGLVGPAQRALAARRRPLNRVSAKEMLGVVAKAAPKVSGAGKRAAAVQQKNRSTKLRRQSPTSAGIARPACGAKQQGLTNARAVTASKSSPDGGAKAANARMLQVLQPRPQPGMHGEPRLTPLAMPCHVELGCPRPLQGRPPPLRPAGHRSSP